MRSALRRRIESSFDPRPSCEPNRPAPSETLMIHGVNIKRWNGRYSHPAARVARQFDVPDLVEMHCPCCQTSLVVDGVDY